jgi:hypothetical protein
MNHDKSQPSRLIFKPHSKAAPRVEAPMSEEERLRLAREKAEKYRNPEQVIDEQGDVVERMDEYATLVTKRIEEAMRKGEFDNLAGSGKPMRLEKNPFVPEGQEMANAILKNNNMTPNWIADRNEMLAAIERWRTEFQRVAGEANGAWAAAGSDQRRVKVREVWARWLDRWSEEIKELNRRIGTHNMMQPIKHLEIFKLILDDELKKVGMARTLE